MSMSFDKSQSEDQMQISFETVDHDEKSELEALRSELAAVKLELAAVKVELEKERRKNAQRFDAHVLEDDSNINHYTAFPSRCVFDALFQYLNPGEDGENMLLYNSQSAKENETRGRKRVLSPLQSFILTMCRLRRNYDVVHLAFLFKVSAAKVTNSVTTWINFMYVKLGSIPIWPTMESVKRNMTKEMKEKFPNVKCIIDCVEFKVAVPSSLVLHKMMYSDYKIYSS